MAAQAQVKAADDTRNSLQTLTMWILGALLAIGVPLVMFLVSSTSARIEEIGKQTTSILQQTARQDEAQRQIEQRLARIETKLDQQGGKP